MNNKGDCFVVYVFIFKCPLFCLTLFNSAISWRRLLLVFTEVVGVYFLQNKCLMSRACDIVLDHKFSELLAIYEYYFCLDCVCIFYCVSTKRTRCKENTFAGTPAMESIHKFMDFRTSGCVFPAFCQSYEDLPRVEKYSLLLFLIFNIRSGRARQDGHLVQPLWTRSLR